LDTTCCIVVNIVVRNISSLVSAPPKITIDKKLEDTIIVNANKSAIIEVPFTCHPQPKITWQYNGGKLPNPHRMTHETIYNMTALTVSRAERGDTGSYTVAIENPHGKVSATVKVQVIGEWQSDLLPGTLLLLCREVAFFVCVPSRVREY